MKYCVMTENVSIEGENCTTYGIRTVEDDCGKSVAEFNDVSVDRELVESIVELLNSNDVEICHFRDVVIDELNR